ncbi:MAG TPA: phospholipase D-like domain-containing protein [Acidobacteriota bacterium]|nr:phospholipase D-like domain-containing protein [Acidobacteriota bacterium]
MLRKQWAISALVFAASLYFLLYSSQQFFSQRKEEPQNAALPSAKEPGQNIILLANKDYYPFLKQHFQNAKHRIIGTVFLIKLTSHRENEPADLLRVLIAAAKRKVDVTLVLEISSDIKETTDANMQAAKMLLDSGIKVRFDHDHVTTHSKVFVIDDRYCFVGSHNFTHAALAMNQELSLFVDSPGLAAEITTFIRQIPLSSEKVASSLRPVH